jgi:hypothetical protein
MEQERRTRSEGRCGVRSAGAGTAISSDLSTVVATLEQHVGRLIAFRSYHATIIEQLRSKWTTSSIALALTGTS